MNLENFEAYIDPKIITRGLDYYENSQVFDMEQLKKGIFTAVVWGSYKYAVTVQLDEHLNIIDHSCSCPYDWGYYCKHFVAVLFQISKNEAYKKSPGTSGKLGIIKTTLDTCSKGKLKKLIIDLAKSDPELRNEILQRLGFEFDEDF